MSRAPTVAKQAKFALQCRQVRLLIATNPGIPDIEIKAKVGFKPDRHLMKMVTMGIITQDGGWGGGWSVVPQ